MAYHTLASKDGSIILAHHLVARLQSMFLERLCSHHRAILKKSHGRLSIVNATKRDGGEVKLGSVVLELIGLGHLGGTILMLIVVELGRREVCFKWRSFGLHEFLLCLERTNVNFVERLIVLEEDSLGDVIVQSHHEVELQPNLVVHDGSSQGFIHLLEVLFKGIGSLDDVLQLVQKMFVEVEGKNSCCIPFFLLGQLMSKFLEGLQSHHLNV